MTKQQRRFVVSGRDGLIAERVVKTTSMKAAIAHIASTLLEARLATMDDIERLAGMGIRTETPGAAQEVNAEPMTPELQAQLDAIAKAGPSELPLIVTRTVDGVLYTNDVTTGKERPLNRLEHAIRARLSEIRVAAGGQA